jgi:hypothetical protein
VPTLIDHLDVNQAHTNIDRLIGIKARIAARDRGRDDFAHQESGRFDDLTAPG